MRLFSLALFTTLLSSLTFVACDDPSIAEEERAEQLTPEEQDSPEEQLAPAEQPADSVPPTNGIDEFTPLPNAQGNFQLDEEFGGGGVDCCALWAGDGPGCENCKKKQGQSCTCS